MGKNSYDIISPVTGQVQFSVPYLSPEEAEHVLARAERAAAAARESQLGERIALCLRFLDCFEAELEEHARAISLMMGKPLAQARGEFGGMKARTQTMCELAQTALAPTEIERGDGIQRSITREPLGVVLDIAAWNYPLLVAINIVVPAVLAGNSVLIKHAPQTALVGQQLASAFAKAGAPDGLVQDFFVDHELAGAIIESGRLGYVGFTGSVRGGQAVLARARSSQRLSCGLELGGKDAAIVLPDADLEHAVASLVDGAFYNSGQSCCAVERIYVHESLEREFVERFVTLTRDYICGDPLSAETQLGPVISKASKERLAAQVTQARSAGAHLLVGDANFSLPEQGAFCAPHVLTAVPQDCELMQDESFGPVIGIRSFATNEEALALANDSRYGLTASLWTRDLKLARALGQQLQVGTVFCNRADFVDPELPWSGTKDSGLGCTLSPLGLQALTRPKGYHLRGPA